MNNRSKISILFVFLMILSYGCNKDEVQAEKSIEGEWNITAITSIYGEFTANSFNPTETINESGQLGTFSFTETRAEFSFTRNDTLYEGSGTWNLTTEKVNAGFTKVTEFSLMIENHFDFKVTFEDGTKNAEKNAKKATLVDEPSEGEGVFIEFVMEKM